VTDTSRIDLDDYLPYLVNRVGMAVAARFTAETLVHHDLSIAMWRVMVALSTRGAQRQIDLSGMTAIDVSTLSRLVARLVRRGLVTRSRSKSSSREVVVDLATKGRALVERLLPEGHAIEAASIAGIAPKDLAVAKQVLRQVYRNLAAPRRNGREVLPTHEALKR
jgi:DNA-binding MarR family transcriptional regulator